MSKEHVPAVFENFDIRRVYDEEKEVRWFSVVDIIAALIQQSDFQSTREYLEQAERAAQKGRQSVGDKM